MHKRTAHGEDVTAESEAQLYHENQASGMINECKDINFSHCGQNCPENTLEKTTVFSGVVQDGIYDITNKFFTF